jgi:hypothetical protein
LINSFTAPLQHCTLQGSISATFQTSLYMMTVCMEMLPDSHTCFQISKTSGCFLWILCMCRIIYWKLCVNELLN